MFLFSRNVCQFFWKQFIFFGDSQYSAISNLGTVVTKGVVRVSVGTGTTNVFDEQENFWWY